MEGRDPARGNPNATLGRPWNIIISVVEKCHKRRGRIPLPMRESKRSGNAIKALHLRRLPLSHILDAILRFWHALNLAVGGDLRLEMA